MKDVQNQSDTRGVEIQKVGIKGLELPLAIQRKDAEDIVIYSAATAGVTLPAHYKGTHMSRFVEVLNEWRSKKTLGIDIKGCVEAIVQKLDAKCGYLKFDFKYFINKKSPVTGISAPMCYDCFFEGMGQTALQFQGLRFNFVAVEVQRAAGGPQQLVRLLHDDGAAVPPGAHLKHIVDVAVADLNAIGFLIRLEKMEHFHGVPLHILRLH